MVRHLGLANMPPAPPPSLVPLGMRIAAFLSEPWGWEKSLLRLPALDKGLPPLDQVVPKGILLRPLIRHQGLNAHLPKMCQVPSLFFFFDRRPTPGICGRKCPEPRRW